MDRDTGDAGSARCAKTGFVDVIYELAENTLNSREIGGYVNDLDVQREYERLRFIREWAEYVRTNSDDGWGEQVNRLVDSQIRAARNVGDERPDTDRLPSESALLNPDAEDEATDPFDAEPDGRTVSSSRPFGLSRGR